ncbi:MAG: undecaprenyldiphospho-muramoylpentapeptide beta-N-acetylglucosaminyltransferase [Pseudobdellovibrio sp.]
MYIDSELKNKKIIIAGGGTGGHIYPAISIAEALWKKAPQTEILFVGTPLGLESKILSKLNYKLELIQSGKLNFKGQIFQKIKTLIKIPVGILQSIGIILKFKPDVVLGVGGYASAPMLMAAVLCGKKTMIWEPNAHPGMANRILSKFVPRAYLVFDEAKKYMQSREQIVLGMPLREEIENKSQREVLEHKDSSVFTILCFGGSQGSQFLNDKLSDFVLSHPELHNKIRVFHQTGSLDYQRIKNKYRSVSCVEVFEYIYDMPRYYQQADVLFCRGGASTLSEAAAFGVVPIVVPLPAADDHQQRNAEALVGVGAAYMLLQKQFDAKEFENILLNLMSDSSLKNRMSEKLKHKAPIGASQNIARDILARG